MFTPSNELNDLVSMGITVTGRLPAPGLYEHALRRSFEKSSKASMNDLCNVNDICWSVIRKREIMSSVQFHGSVDDPSGLTNQAA